jgi:uncharacterized YccA/Bax inhibitor family protein
VRSSNPAWRGAGFQTMEPGNPYDVTITSTDARMTMEDVIVHTVGVFLMAIVAAGFGWVLVGSKPGPVMVAGLAAFALSFAIGFSRVTRPALVVAFSLLEGFALGGVSRYYAEINAGHGGANIVVQALLGTAVIFVVMLGLHRSGRLRATPRMQKIVTATIIGVIGLSLVNFVLLAVGGSAGLSIFSPTNGSMFSILVSVAILVVASLMFTLDFAYIESAIAAGVPRREAWRASYGLLVSFVWVYLELLRLLSKLNSNR